MKIYQINLYYVKYLQTIDKRVMWPKEAHFTRPYVGVIFNIDNYRFFGPLTSNKQNKEKWSIIKLSPADGSIFLTNMIPVPEIYLNELVSSIDIKDLILDTDHAKSNYGFKLLLQSLVINISKIEQKLFTRSKKIYRLQKFSPFYKKICCDFIYLQQKSLLWHDSYWYLFWYLRRLTFALSKQNYTVR